MSEKPAPQNRLRKIRQQIGLSQKELAVQAGTSVYSVRGIESRRRNVSPQVLVSLVDALAKAAGHSGAALSFGQVFPQHLGIEVTDVATESAVSESSGQFFALDDGPFGTPPVVRIRGFSVTAQGCCGMPSFLRSAFNFTTTDKSCSGSPMCQSEMMKALTMVSKMCGMVLLAAGLTNGMSHSQAEAICQPSLVARIAETGGSTGRQVRTSASP